MTLTIDWPGSVDLLGMGASALLAKSAGIPMLYQISKLSLSTVNSPAGFQEGVLQIVDVYGKPVWRQAIRTDEYPGAINISTQNFQQGTYFLFLADKNGASWKTKLIVQH